MIKVRLSRDAAEYIRREALYLRQRSSAAARNFSAAMKNAREILQQFPASGNRSHGLQIKGGLTLVAGDYLIDYIYEGDCVDIILIRHGRMLGLSPDIHDADEE